MDQMREERTRWAKYAKNKFRRININMINNINIYISRLSVALDFSKDERNQLIKQLKELEDKTGILSLSL